ncbi:hypothetical protein PYW08_013919 [Mythimna loreyi]|uniref:Uncharacterized protein n=1 Tax=Mythimna loreyi TaxID=667449 RepID=A0ACC2R607_9NEOP|nr:hypothetical protein PYW08_013919 [Mythimna loreyi]
MLLRELLLILPLVVAVTVGQANRGYDYSGTSNVRYQRPEPTYGQPHFVLPGRSMPAGRPVAAVPVQPIVTAAPETLAVSSAPVAPAVTDAPAIPAAPVVSDDDAVHTAPAPVIDGPVSATYHPEPRPLYYPVNRPLLPPRLIPSAPPVTAPPQPIETVAPQLPVTEAEPLVPPSEAPRLVEEEQKPIPIHPTEKYEVTTSQPGDVIKFFIIPAPVTEIAPKPSRLPEPVLQPEPVIQPEPIQEPEPIRVSEPITEPEPPIQPVAILEPKPIADHVQPEPSAQPEPSVQPEPIAQPEPIQPQPIPQAETIALPEPILQPQPVLQPAVFPEREAAPLLKPKARPINNIRLNPPQSDKPVAIPPLLPKPESVREVTFGRPSQTTLPPVIYYTTPARTMATQPPPVFTERTHPEVLVTIQPHPLVTQAPGLLKSDFQCIEGNGYYSVEHECDTYIECKSNRAMKYACPDGLHFNPAAKHFEYPCAYPSEVKCLAGYLEQTPKATDRCPNQYGFYSMNDGDCSKFIMCQEGLATIMDCPMGLVFNSQTSTCDWPANVPQCNPNVFKDITCPEPPKDENGNISDIIYKYRYGQQCKLYVACQLGRPRLLSCDRGLAFDHTSQACIDEDYVTDCAVPYTNK